MKVLLVCAVCALVAAEPPSRFRTSARQSVAPGTFQPPAPQSAPYNPRGWRPQGAAFALPRSQPQQAYGPPSPQPSYGPPPEETTTTEDGVIESTEQPQVTKFTSSQQSSKTESEQKQSPGSYYVVLPRSAIVLREPQSQNLVYALTTEEKSSPLVVSVPQTTLVAAPLTSSALLQASPAPTLKYVNYNLW